MTKTSAAFSSSFRFRHPSFELRHFRCSRNKNFTFRQAREIVPYLDQLGISHAYASPYFQAGAESMHGYDITDHNKLNAAIGSREDYDAWVAELHAHGMGQIVDFVPNHMGINDPQNVWWQDVLENGPSSLYAPYFDIDWRPLKTDLHEKVLLPILGDQYGRVLERGELKVRFDAGSFSLNYFDHVFPIAPGTYRYIPGPRPIPNASRSARGKRRSSKNAWNVVARKRHRCCAQLKKQSRPLMATSATRVVSIGLTNY
ncbi:MAG: hypothetical protein DME42_08275 [Verrucomicrobia bacterium]|nr:MAG: hypothetical protein DME42_08275 [Verrucomicrobiota bacterium]